jgi:cellulose synthase/poly-beta-1,6-N-acetylglucosamine synthase-like glycosyltransferase
VSVIIPCFNLGQYIEDAVDSVSAQTDQTEIVIVNDGRPTTDEHAARPVLAPSTRVCPRTIGPAAARNLAIAHARGATSVPDADVTGCIPRSSKRPRRFSTRTFAGVRLTRLETFGDEQWVWRQIDATSRRFWPSALL